MKKHNFLLLILLLLIVNSCKKNAELTVLKPVAFDSSIKASTNKVILSAANDSSSVLSFSWPAVVYPIKASVTYVLQVALPSDTLGSTAWVNATNIPVGNDVLSKSYKGKDLNALALTMGVPSGTSTDLIFRVQAFQDRYTYTSALTVNVMPYVAQSSYPLLYVPGDYQGWSPATAPVIAALQPKIYEGYVNMPTGGSFHFKFTSAPDWNHINYGDGTAGKLSVDGLAGDLVGPGAGYILLSANLNTNTWMATKTTWSILGDATPGGWNTDTQLNYDATNQVWTVTCDMLATGSFKFRANNAWEIDFGINAEGKLKYADSPVYGYDGTVNNITVPVSGNYTITLDLHNPENYNYKLNKN